MSAFAVLTLPVGRTAAAERKTPEILNAPTPLILPPVSDYLNGPMNAGIRTGLANAGGAVAPGSSAALMPSLHELEQALEQEPYAEGEEPQGVENCYIDPEAIDLSGTDLTTVLCVSVGGANSGRLVHGVPFPASPGISIRAGRNNIYGTPETVAALRYAVAVVQQKHPGAHDVVLGDLSRSGGGKFRPHVSHQNGRDVDLGFYYKGIDKPKEFISATADNLDLERTWTLIEALMEENKVQYIFIDDSVQKLLYHYVKYTLGAPQSYLDTVFTWPRRARGNRALISHAPGHRNHIHVRFWSPIAVAAATGVDLRPREGQPFDPEELSAYRGNRYVSLSTLDRVDWGDEPEMLTVQEWRQVPVSYRIKKNDTLGAVARKHNVRLSDLKKWNNLGGSARLKIGQQIAIFQRQLVDVKVPVEKSAVSVQDVAVAQADMEHESEEQESTGLQAPEDESKVDHKPSRAVQAARAALAAEIAENSFQEIERSMYVSVASGDNLWSIARKHGTSVDQLRTMNGLQQGATLRLGQRLKVKVWQERVPVAPATAAK